MTGRPRRVWIANILAPGRGTEPADEIVTTTEHDTAAAARSWTEHALPAGPTRLVGQIVPCDITLIDPGAQECREIDWTAEETAELDQETGIVTWS